MIFNLKTTTIPYYDDMLQNKYTKGISSKIIYMTPEKYLSECFKLQKYDSSLISLKEHLKNVISIDLVNKYREKTLSGSKMPLVVLDYANGLQEGRHRAVVAKSLKIQKIPVLVVKKIKMVI